MADAFSRFVSTRPRAGVFNLFFSSFSSFTFFSLPFGGIAFSSLLVGFGRLFVVLEGWLGEDCFRVVVTVGLVVSDGAEVVGMEDQ